MKNNIFPKTVFFCLIIFFCFTVLLTKAQSHLQTDQIWLTMETEHFVIIAEASLENQISSLAADCEQAYADLGPLFQWRFLEKPTVLYSDNNDRHNGWANAISHPTLLILASPARNNSFLASACNHRRRTIYHELTHLLQTDARFGIIRRCHSVFGRVFADLMDPLTLVISLLTLPPANAAPTWYLEGTAIWAETQFGNSGRGRNSEVDAVFRTAVDQKRLLPSTHWHLREPDWPYGNTAYLYGMKAIQEAALFPGNHKPSDANLPGPLGDAVARAPIAGWFNSRAINLLNRDFQDITRDALKHEIQFQSDRITVLEQQPLTRLERWSPLNVQVSEPVWTPAGDLWVVAKFEDRRARLVKVDMTSRNFNAFGPRVSQGWTRTSIDPDTGEIYFTRLDGDNGTEWRSFLFRFDPKTGTTRRVHGPERVADLAVTHQGWMALVIRSANSDVLQLWKWKNSDRKELQYQYDCTSPDSSDDVSNSVISSPVFRNQKSGVRSQESGVRSTTEILAHIRQTKDTTTIFQTEPGINDVKTFWESTGSEIRDLSWQPARGFTFCADINGVHNVYTKNNSQELVIPVSHTLGGIYSCEFNWDGSKAALIGMDADGYFLSVIHAEMFNNSNLEKLPQLESPWQLLQKVSDSKPAIDTNSQLDTQITEYKPLENLRFDYWAPWLNWASGYSAGGLATRWTDRSQTHRLFAYCGLESNQDELIGSVHWEYLRERPEFDIYFTRQAPVYSGLMRDNQGFWFDLEEVRWKLTGSACWNWNHADFSATIRSGWQGVYRDVKDADIWCGAMAQDRLQGKPLIDEMESTLWTSATLNTATVYPGSNSLEDGIWGKIVVDWTDNLLGSAIDRWRVRTDFATWLSVPYLKTHVIKITGSYGAAWGDKYAQGAFTVWGYDDLLGGNPPGFASTMKLRGYQGNVQIGDRAARVEFSYRLPLYERYQSFSSRSAIYLTQLMGEFFWETAVAWDSDLDERDWYQAMGVEINAGSIWFTHIDLAPGIGLSWMPDDFEKNVSSPGSGDGDWAIYISLKNTINF